MDIASILRRYGVTKVELDPDLVGWIRSDHAGETGAVWIYKGAAWALWSKQIRDMAAEHGETERQHLVVMDYLLPPSERSRLVFLWKIMGFSLGFFRLSLGLKLSVTLLMLWKHLSRDIMANKFDIWRNKISFLHY